MTTKIYAFLGKNNATIDIPVSATGSMQVEFTGGNIYDEKAFSLARTKPITDPVKQAVIENSPYFGAEVILYESSEEDDGQKKTEVKEYPEVTNFAEACAVLKADYQAKASQLRSPAGVRSLAAAFNVSFPNWDN